MPPVFEGEASASRRRVRLARLDYSGVRFKKLIQGELAGKGKIGVIREFSPKAWASHYTTPMSLCVKTL